MSIPYLAPPPPTHLIRSYFIELTGIREVFAMIVRSYHLSDEILKLDSTSDIDLINWIKLISQLMSPKSDSIIVPTPEELLYNAYWRLYGLVVPGKEQAFVRSEPSNSRFIETFEQALYEIFQIIFDTGITQEKIGSPSKVADALNTWKTDYLNRKNNEMDFIAEYWNNKVHAALLTIIADPAPPGFPNPIGVKLFSKLGIDAQGPDQRLIALSEKVKVPAAKQTKYLFSLADKMEFLLQTVVSNLIDAPFAASLASQVDFFKELAAANLQVRGVDVSLKALQDRKRA